MASDLGLYYLYMSNKKNARLIWVKYFCCICYSHQLYCFFVELDNDRIYICIGMVFAICGTETAPIKTGFFVMARINVCFNVSFLDFNQYCK